METKAKLSNYFKPTPKNIQKWLLAIKAIIGTIAVSEFASGSPHVAFYLMLAGAILEEGSKLFAEE